MANYPANQTMKRILYSLKHMFGQEIEIVWQSSNTRNLETGIKTVAKDSVMVRRGIVLPSKIKTSFSYDLAFIAAAKNFTYGALFDETRRRFIFDRSDLPSGFEIKTHYYLVVGGVRYDVEQVEEFEQNSGYLVIGKQVTDQPLENAPKRSAYSSLILDQTVEVVIE